MARKDTKEIVKNEYESFINQALQAKIDTKPKNKINK